MLKEKSKTKLDESCKEIENLKKQNEFLLKEQHKLKEYAEKQGSEAAKWKHDYLRLEEKYEQVKK